MLSDKKVENGVVMVVLLDNIGKYREINNRFSFPVEKKIVKDSINICKSLG
jgi:3-dehydroquinate synthetase